MPFDFNDLPDRAKRRWFAQVKPGGGSRVTKSRIEKAREEYERLNPVDEVGQEALAASDPSSFLSTWPQKTQWRPEPSVVEQSMYLQDVRPVNALLEAIARRLRTFQNSDLALIPKWSLRLVPGDDAEAGRGLQIPWGYRLLLDDVGMEARKQIDWTAVFRELLREDLFRKR